MKTYKCKECSRTLFEGELIIATIYKICPDCGKMNMFEATREAIVKHTVRAKRGPHQ